MTLQTSDVRGDIFTETDKNGIGNGRIGAFYRTRVRQDTFRIQETHRQLDIIARRAHGDGNALLLPMARGAVLQAYLQWLFHRQFVRLKAHLTFVEARYVGGQMSLVHDISAEERRGLPNGLIDAPECGD